MGSNLQNVLKRHYKALTLDPDHFVGQAAAKAIALKNPTLEEFDDSFTRIAGGPSPVFPFPSSKEYYRSMSSHHILRDVQVPYLAISAADDPIIRHVPVDGGGNPFVVMTLTSGGGHLGWFQAGGKDYVDRWTTRPVLEWLRLMGDDAVHSPRGRNVFVDEEGWLREEGQPHLGCLELFEEGVIDGTGSDPGVLQGL